MEETPASVRLVQFAKTIRWFDEMAYSQKGPTGFPGAKGHYRKKGNWSPDDNALIHWLCYIADRQSDVKAIWTRGVDAFAGAVDLVKNCRNDTEEMVRELGQAELPPPVAKKSGKRKDWKRPTPDAEHRRMSKFGCGYDPEIGYTPRFPIDKYLAVRTLCLLKLHGLSFAGFIRTACVNWENAHVKLEQEPAADFVAKISFAAYLLSYRLTEEEYTSAHQLSRDAKNVADSIKSYARGFNRLVEGKAVRDVFSQWKWHNGVPNRPGGMYSAKRLWCALRDDLRGSDFGEAWGDGFPQDTRVLLPYLEITADLWNERFRKYAVAPWAGDVLKDAPNSDYDLDNIGAWEIRGLYRALWDKEGLPKSDYFPMQTDIAFDFAPKMCDNSETNPKVCANWCPFGKFDEGDKLCAGSELQQGGAGKKCPLLLYTCGLVRDCRPDECYIRNERLKEKGNLAVCAKGA